LLRRLSRELDEKRLGLSEADRLEYQALCTSVGSLSAESVSALRGIAYGPAPEAAGGNPNVLVRLMRALLRFVASLVRRLFRRAAVAEDAQAPARPAVSRERRSTCSKADALPDATSRGRGGAGTGVASAVGTRGAGGSGRRARGSAGVRRPDGRLALDEAVAQFLDGCKKHTLYQVAEAEAEEASRRRRFASGRTLAGRTAGAA